MFLPGMLVMDVSISFEALLLRANVFSMDSFSLWTLLKRSIQNLRFRGFVKFEISEQKYIGTMPGY